MRRMMIVGVGLGLLTLAACSAGRDWSGYAVSGQEPAPTDNEPANPSPSPSTSATTKPSGSSSSGQNTSSGSSGTTSSSSSGVVPDGGGGGGGGLGTACTKYFDSCCIELAAGQAAAIQQCASLKSTTLQSIAGGASPSEFETQCQQAITSAQAQGKCK